MSKCLSKCRGLTLLLTTAVLLGANVGCRRNRGIKYVDNKALTPLMNAAAHSDLDRVRQLILQGADVRERSKTGETALYWAIDRRFSADNLPVVAALLEAGADPNDVSLAVAITRDEANAAVTLLLIRSGARVPTTCGSGDSLLSLATMDGSAEIMQALIEKKAPVNCQDAYGRTALYWASLNGETDRVAVLLRNGADPTLHDSGGQTALDVAVTTNPEPRVQADFAKTRELLKAAVGKAGIQKSH